MLSYCVFDDNIPIDDDNFAVGIMRKPEGKNSEHAFLVVEGRDPSGNTIFRRYDLFIDQNSTEGKALIRIQPDLVCPVGEAKERFANDILNNEEVYNLAWSIDKQQAESLHEDILKDRDNPPVYQVSGDKSLIAKSSSKEGQSCFSWARHKLHNLKDERVRMSEKYSDFIGAKTSLYLTGVKK